MSPTMAIAPVPHPTGRKSPKTWGNSLKKCHTSSLSEKCRSPAHPNRAIKAGEPALKWSGILSVPQAQAFPVLSHCLTLSGKSAYSALWYVVTSFSMMKINKPIGQGTSQSTHLLSRAPPQISSRDANLWFPSGVSNRTLDWPRWCKSHWIHIVLGIVILPTKQVNQNS